jgi:hypothetical protein
VSTECPVSCAVRCKIAFAVASTANPAGPVAIFAKIRATEIFSKTKQTKPTSNRSGAFVYDPGVLITFLIYIHLGWFTACADALVFFAALVPVSYVAVIENCGAMQHQNVEPDVPGFVSAVVYLATHTQATRDLADARAQEASIDIEIAQHDAPSASPEPVADAARAEFGEGELDVGAFEPHLDPRLVRTLTQFGGGNNVDIFEAARRGDVRRLKHLVETDAVNVNETDDFDGTPLYYASLCGHFTAVTYLLEQGARCEGKSAFLVLLLLFLNGAWILTSPLSGTCIVAKHTAFTGAVDTFDGERCHYGALNDQIRVLLRQYQAVNRQRGPLFAFTYRALSNASLCPDFAFILPNNERLHVHRCILAARSPYFRQHFAKQGRWHDRLEVPVPDNVAPEAVQVVVSFMYTERLVCPALLLPAVHLLARNFRLRQLSRFLYDYRPVSVLDGASSLASIMVAVDLGLPYEAGAVPQFALTGDDDLLDAPRTSNGDVKHPRYAATEEPSHASVEESSYNPQLTYSGDVPYPKRNPHKDTAKHSTAEFPAEAVMAACFRRGLRQDVWNNLLTRVVLPAGLRPVASGSDNESALPNSNVGSSAVQDWEYDFEFLVDGHSFKCHRVFVCGRSSYLAGMVSFYDSARQFDEAQHSKRAAIQMHDVSAHVFAAILQYIYTDSLPLFDDTCLPEALQACELFAMPTAFRALVTAQAAAAVRLDTVLTYMQLADLFNLERLTEVCSELVVDNLDHMLCQDEFVGAVRASARTISQRQEFDSIPVLDEIISAIRRRLEAKRLEGLASARGRNVQKEAEFVEQLRRVKNFAAELGFQLRLDVDQIAGISSREGPN